MFQCRFLKPNFLDNTKCKYKIVIKTLDENEDLRTPKAIDFDFDFSIDT